MPLRLTDSGGAASLTLAIGPARTQSIAASTDARGYLVTPHLSLEVGAELPEPARVL